jgi:hypothetical protein
MRVLAGWVNRRHMRIAIGHFRAMRVLISLANSMKRLRLTVFASVPCEKNGSIGVRSRQAQGPDRTYETQMLHSGRTLDLP